MLKFLFLLIFLLIIFNLFTALYHLVKGQNEAGSQKTVKALTFRIGLSIALFIILFIAYALGWVQPEGIGSRIHGNNKIETPLKASESTEK